MVVIYPIDTNFKKTEFVTKSILVLYISSLFIAIFITYYFKFTYDILPISLCLPFIDPTNSILLIKIITWLVVITQTLNKLSDNNGFTYTSCPKGKIVKDFYQKV